MSGKIYQEKKISFGIKKKEKKSVLKKSRIYKVKTSGMVLIGQREREVGRNEWIVKRIK